MDVYQFRFGQFFSAVIQSLGVFLNYSLIGFLIGLAGAIFFSCLLTRMYRKRCHTDDAKTVYVFSIIILCLSWTVPLLISGALGGAFLAYKTVLVKEIRKNAEKFTNPELAEVFIVFGELEKLSETDPATVGSNIQKGLDSFHKTGNLPLYTLVSSTNRFVEKLPQIVDKQLKIPEIAQNLSRLTDNKVFGKTFSSADIYSGFSAAMQNNSDFQNLILIWKWFTNVTTAFEKYLAEHAEYQGEITKEQFCNAQINFLLDGLIGNFLREKFVSYFSLTIFIIIILTGGTFALVAFFSRPQDNIPAPPSGAA